ncbi:MAG: hypothetical protein FWF69_00045 [Firmicutes bacterium]|nr:hypothetical protein [Bacillota bacterium]
MIWGLMLGGGLARCRPDCAGIAVNAKWVNRGRRHLRLGEAVTCCGNGQNILYIEK